MCAGRLETQETDKSKTKILKLERGIALISDQNTPDKTHPEILRKTDRMKSAKGKRSLLKYASGERITPTEAIRAKCYDCQAYYEDISSVRDCAVKDCPLYPFHPYSSDKTQNKPAMDMKDRIERGEFQFSGFRKKSGEETISVAEKTAEETE